MGHFVFSAAALAAAIAIAGCSSDGGNSGGSGGNGGSAGTGGGPDLPLSFDETTSLPATAASAAAMEAATRFGNAVSSILGLITAGSDAAVTGASPKVLLPGFCPGGGSADLEVPSGLPPTWSPGDQILLTLMSCEGSVLAAGAISGSIDLEIEGVTVVGPVGGTSVDLSAAVNLTGDATITGSFKASVDIAISQVGLITRLIVRLGKQLDGDRLSLSDGSLNLELGCFDIDVFLSTLEDDAIAPLAVAKLGNQVYTINDYALPPPLIAFDGGGVPKTGELSMHSGDNSAASPDRSAACYPNTPPGNGSTITATFSDGGCIQLSGAVSQSSSWDKLRSGDLSPGGGEGCDGMSQTPAMAPAVSCPDVGDIVASIDGYVRGGTHAETSFVSAANLLLKGSPDFEFARKIYLAFDLASIPLFTKASLVLTLDRHVMDPVPGDLSAIIDNDDWDPAAPTQNPITWNNAPRNDTASGVAFLDQGIGPDDGVRKLVRGYDFDREDIAEFPDPSGTQYAFDVTEFIQWAVGQNEEFSSAADQDDDGIVTLLLALSAEGNADGSSLRSLENQDGDDDCDQPFLHFEFEAESN